MKSYSPIHGLQNPPACPKFGLFLHRRDEESSHGPLKRLIWNRPTPISGSVLLLIALLYKVGDRITWASWLLFQQVHGHWKPSSVSFSSTLMFGIATAVRCFKHYFGWYKLWRKRDLRGERFLKSYCGLRGDLSIKSSACWYFGTACFHWFTG